MRVSSQGICFCIIILLQLFFGSCNTRISKRPNVVLLQLDDLGFDDLGLHGNSNVETPSLDQLGERSIQFSRFYVNPVCAPSRAGLLTGRHYLKTGVSHVHGGRDFIHLDETLMPKYFREAGYRTGMWGKWHSGKTSGYLPWDRGFDEAYMASLYKHENSRGLLNGMPVEHTRWADEVIVDYAIDFMSVDQSQPFFAYLSFLTCHRPLVAPEEIIAKYRKKGIPEDLATLYAMVDHVDQHIGRLLDFIQETGLAENTIILFMSDNGPDFDAFDNDKSRDLRTVNHFRGYKGDIWENGVKSPLFVRWGDRFAAKKVDDFISVTDILPTLLDLCDISIESDKIKLDGSSFRSVLEGNQVFTRKAPIINYSDRSWPPAHKYQRYLDDQYNPKSSEDKSNMPLTEQVISITRPPYKLLLNPNNQPDTTLFFLMNLVDDPLEMKNLSLEEPSVAKELTKELASWWDELIYDPNSFSSPVFSISADREDQVLLMSPFRKSPVLRTSYRGINRWETDAVAEYQIDVKSAGNYQLNLTHSQVESLDHRFQITLNQEQVVKNITANQSTNIGTFHLDKGPGSIAISQIDGPEDPDLKLFELVFTYVDDK